MKKAVDSFLIIAVSAAIALTLAHCSGCVLLIPEGEASWDYEQAQEEAQP